jgi:arylsulfatase A-like enzyme
MRRPLSSRFGKDAKRVLAIAVALASATALLGCERPVPAASVRERLAELQRPNLVLIVVDTLRADWTTPYGYAADTSPELARWAARGVVFEQVLAQSSWTKISMASLMTSMWPRSHGIREPNDGLADTALTLAEVLRQAGYRTYAVQTNGWLDQSFGFQQGFDRYVFPGGKGAPLPKPTVWPHADRVYEEAERLIDAHSGEEPFFLYLHFMDVHEYAAPPQFKEFGTTAKGDYLAAIRWIDDAVRRVREKLDDAGQLARTVMVFSSDHGEAFGENGRHGHARNVLTAVLSVPLLMRLPFAVEPIRVSAQVRNLDIAPTLLELAGVESPPSFEGRSLLTLLGVESGRANRESYAGLGFPLYRDASVQVSLSDGSWTYARNVEPDPRREELLFDRRVDPGENVNVIELEPAQAARLRGLLDTYLEGKPASEVRETDVRIDPSIARRLRAMGYLQ